jgi:tetratricopeptide (TPR) repeat protein
VYKRQVLGLFPSLEGHSQINVDSLIDRGQYLTAFEVLSNHVENDAVSQVIKKVDLALNYYLNSYYHKQFSFVNLRNGENLERLRKINPFGSTPFRFAIDSTLHQLHSEYPDDYRISKVLGDFYDRIYYDFGDRWGESSEELLKKSNQYYLEAYEHGVYDYYSLYALGYYQSLSQNYFEAQEWFLKSLKNKADIPLTNYSLAVTYLLDGLPKKGIEFAERAYLLYTDSLKKSDAGRICGILLMKIQEPEKALDYFEKADSLNPDYRPNLLYMLSASLLIGEDSLIIFNGYKALQSDLYAPGVPEELNSLFMREQKVNLLHEIYDKGLVEYKNDGEACGNIRFHYGKLLFKEGKRRQAIRMIKRSRKDFMLVFDESHQVFEAIEQTLIHLASSGKTAN